MDQTALLESDRVSASTTAYEQELLLPINIITLLNALPVTLEPDKGREGVERAIQGFLSDVDRVVVSVNYECDLLAPLRQAKAKRQQEYEMRRSRKKTTYAQDDPIPEEIVAVHDVIGEWETQERQSHLPVRVDYLYAKGLYLGSIVLLRDRRHPCISRETIALVEGLEPFFITVLSNLVAACRLGRAQNEEWADPIRLMEAEGKFTKRDMEIVARLFRGKSYNETAAELGITTDSVRKHMKKVYHRTETGRLIELHAKYFGPYRDV